MPNEFVLFQQFTDKEAAEDFASELRNNHIEYQLADHDHDINTKAYHYNTVQLSIAVLIQQQDFAKADEILNAYYAAQLENIDTSYYLFSATDAELKVIIKNPFDWGRLDYLLAKKLLNQRGISVTEEEIEQIKQDRLQELTQKQDVEKWRIAAGYAATLTAPVVALTVPGIWLMFTLFILFIPALIGVTIFYNRKILPTGERFYIHPEKDRKHGKLFMLASLLFVFSYIIYSFYLY